jgi:hypothetical protein
LIRRLPARESRRRIWPPEEASMGAVPVREANRLRSAKRGDVTDVGQNPGGTGRADPVDLQQPATGLGDRSA